jgi:hypothetical protein
MAPWVVAEFSPALARASSMGRSFYAHNRNRIRIARPRRAGSSGVLLPHRRLLELATASAQQPKHQRRNHNRGNADSTNAELGRLRTFQAVKALETRGRDRAAHAGTAAELTGPRGPRAGFLSLMVHANGTLLRARPMSRSVESSPGKANKN